MRLRRPREVVPGVCQISLPRSAVTVLAGQDGLVLVDAGWHGSIGRIAEGLRALGASLADVRLIVATHYHPDHAGGLAELAVATSAPVAAHRAEARAISGQEPLPSPFRNPAMARAMRPLVSRLSGARVPVTCMLDDGIALPVGPEVRVVHTPGHTPGSISLRLPEHRLLIVGDALQYRFRRLGLPARSVTWDIKEAVRSLEKLAALDVETICFSHFPPLRHGAQQALRRLIEKETS